MRKALLVIAPLVLLAAAAYGGWQWWTNWRFLESTDDAYIDADISVISPKVEGYIKDVRVDSNQRVKAGQVLFVIDDEDFAAKLAQAEAVVATEEAAVATYSSRLGMQQAMISQAQAAEQAAEADETRTRQDLKRYTALVSVSIASRQQFDTANADARKAAAVLAKTRDGLVAEKNQLAMFQSQKQEQAARLAQARAALLLTQNNLANTVIRAPVDGVAGNRAGQIGQYVKPGTQLLSLVPLPHVYVTANFKETQLTHMRPGQTATIEVDAYPDQPLEGRVESFAPATGAEFSILPPDNATGNFTKIVQRVPVEIDLAAGGPLVQLLRPGLSVTVTVDTRTGGTQEAGGGLVGTAQAAPAAAK
ncbi:MAG TPA: HlyD family secretion protein [Stellaceae bacterium]|nr:HlyD family secretion protein [Stellaceae bacterium]